MEWCPGFEIPLLKGFLGKWKDKSSCCVNTDTGLLYLLLIRFKRYLEITNLSIKAVSHLQIYAGG